MIQASVWLSRAQKAKQVDAAAIHRAAETRLRRSQYSQVRKVRCCFQCGVLTLTGEVPTFFLKQTAQELLRDLDHVSTIDNQIKVTEYE